MEILQSFYKKKTQQIIVFLAFVWFGLFQLWYQLVAPYFEIKIQSPFWENLTDFFLGGLMTGGIVTFLYGIIERYIRKTYWKKKFPHLNFDGRWSGATQYTEYIEKQNKNNYVLVRSNTSSPEYIVFEQDCLHISIKDSPSVDSNDFSWKSLAVELDMNGNLKILYEVNYYKNLRKKGYPDRITGYEDMIQIDKNNMNGKFYHCFRSDASKIFTGTVNYQRIQ